MAHKQCIDKLDKRCDCIIDDILELETLKININNLEKIIYHYYEVYKNNPSISTLSHFLKLRLKIENELEK